jgi:hypothetical protein
MPQCVHDNTEDEYSHFKFLNAYLAARGGRPVSLERFRKLPSGQASGAKQINGLTNLMELTVAATVVDALSEPEREPGPGRELRARRARPGQRSVSGHPPDETLT